jgi:tripartite-type tricarboxylate transporter receptor subunit TctC
LNIQRRQLIKLLGAATAVPILPKMAWTQDYPTRPIRLVVGFPAGGSPDIVARLVGQALSIRLGQPIIIDNRPGAGSNIATETVVRSKPDGYTLLLVLATNAINATLYKKLNFDFARDIAPIAGIMSVPNVLVVNPSVPAKSVLELIALAKSSPGKLNIANTGLGSTAHIAGDLFKMMTGTDMVDVPYHGGPDMFTSLMGGQVQVLFGLLPSTIGFVKAGKLRALAITSTKRSDLMPDVPTVSESVPGYEATSWQGIGAPRNTPIEIINRLNVEIRAVLAEANLKARLVELGGSEFDLSPSEFSKFVVAETEKWGGVVEYSGAKAD